MVTLINSKEIPFRKESFVFFCFYLGKSLILRILIYILIVYRSNGNFWLIKFVFLMLFYTFITVKVLLCYTNRSDIKRVLLKEGSFFFTVVFNQKKPIRFRDGSFKRNTKETLQRKSCYFLKCCLYFSCTYMDSSLKPNAPNAPTNPYTRAIMRSPVVRKPAEEAVTEPA